MNIKILKSIKKYILSQRGIYIYESDNELDNVANWIIDNMNKLNKQKNQGIISLEVQEGILHLVEDFSDSYIVRLKIPLQNTEDFKKIYDMLNEKLSLKIGLHHNFGRSGFQYNIFISRKSIDLISDNKFDKNWLREYYQRDNLENSNQPKSYQLKK